MKVLRTPDERFNNLPDFPYQPHYLEVPDGDGGTTKDARWRIQARPRLEVVFGPVELGVGAELNYSQDRNDSPPAGQDTLTLVRDNFRSRDARLDLAYGRLKLGPIQAEGGRFVMPIPLSEMAKRYK